MFESVAPNHFLVMPAEVMTGQARSVYAPVEDGSREWIGRFHIDTDGAAGAMRDWMEDRPGVIPPITFLDGAGMVIGLYVDGVDQWEADNE